MALQRHIRDFIDAWYRLHPDQATEKGYKKYDGASPDFSAEALEEYRRAVARARAAVEGLDDRDLSLDDAVDLRAFRAVLSTATFETDELGWLYTSPLLYIGTALDGIDNLDLRRDLRDDVRDALLRERLLALPRVLAQARANVAVPVDCFRDAAQEMLEGAVEAFGQRFVPEAASPATVAGAKKATRALQEAIEHWARAETRSFIPMGEIAYRMLLEQRHLITGGVEPLLALAYRTLDRVDAELAAVNQTDARAVPPAPEGFGHDDVIEAYQRELRAVRRFIVDNDLLTLPRMSVVLHEVGPHMRALIQGPSYVPPPAFARKTRGTLLLQPIPREMNDEERQDWWSRVAQRRFRIAVAHEVWPGHHVQLTRAAQHERAVRKFKDDDVMMEGWGLYSEMLVRDHGLYDGDEKAIGPLYALRFRACRVVVDICIHTGRMTLDGAVDWMCSVWGEERRPWLRKEVRRYACEPLQAMSYLVGQQQIVDLREEWRDAVGKRRFSLRDFHDRFLGEGSLPVPLIRERMLATRRR